MIPRKTTPGISQTAGDARYLEESENLDDLDAKATARANLGTDAAGDARPPTAHSQAASTISDSTAAGRTLLTAADAAAQLTALGADAAGTARPASTVDGTAAATVRTGAAAGATASQPGHAHTGGDVTSGTVDAARLPAAITAGAAAGSTASQPGHTHAPGDVTGTAVVDADPRLSDARTPTAHAHAPADVTGTAVVDADPRLTDARTPTAHTHGGGDITSSVADADDAAALGGVAAATVTAGAASGATAVQPGDLAVISAYLGTTPPTGTARVVYQFDGGANALKDRTDLVTGANLTLISGTMRYTTVGNIVGLALDGATRYHAATVAKAQILGALTMEMIAYIGEHDVAAGVFLGCSEISGALETKNALYQIYTNITEVALYGHHNGAANWNGVTFASIFPIYQPSLITITRAADGVTLKLYFNGQLINAQVAANAPTGGSLSYVFVGGNPAGANFGERSAIAGVRITDAEFDAGQVADGWAEVKGI